MYVGASRKVEILAGISYWFELIYKNCLNFKCEYSIVLIFWSKVVHSSHKLNTPTTDDGETKRFTPRLWDRSLTWWSRSLGQIYPWSVRILVVRVPGMISSSSRCPGGSHEICLWSTNGCTTCFLVWCVVCTTTAVLLYIQQRTSRYQNCPQRQKLGRIYSKQYRRWSTSEYQLSTYCL